VLCAMCYVLCAMCYVLCAMCYVLCAMCYVLCAMSDVVSSEYTMNCNIEVLFLFYSIVLYCIVLFIH
jgi:hypothetical protein